MKLASTQGPTGLQIVDEIIYVYNGTGSSTLVGDILGFDLASGLDYNLVSGSTSPWTKVIQPTAIHAQTCPVCVATEAVAAGAYLRAIVRGQVVTAQYSAGGAVTAGNFGYVTNGQRYLTISNTMSGTAHIVAPVTLDAIGGAGTGTINVMFDGVCGGR
jgi:hypothetical protein